MTSSPIPSIALPALPPLPVDAPPAPPTGLRRLLVLRLLFVPLFIFFFWSLSAPNALNTDLWQWTPHAIAPVAGLPYATLAALALFTALSFAAYYLRMSPPSARGPSSQLALTVILFPALMLRIVPLYWWVLPANLASSRGVLLFWDLVTLAALTLTLLLQKRSLWWLILYAWNPLTIYLLAAARIEFIAVAVLAAGALGLEYWHARVTRAFLHALPASAETAGAESGRRSSYVGSLFQSVFRAPLVSYITALSAAATALFVFLAPFSGPWPKLSASNSLLIQWLRRVVHPDAPSAALTQLYVLFGIGLLVIALLSVCRRWSPARTLGHAILLAVVCTPNPQPQTALYPLVLLPLAWNSATWTLALTILPLLLASWWSPDPLPDYLLLVVWLPPLVLIPRQWVCDALFPPPEPKLSSSTC